MAGNPSRDETAATLETAKRVSTPAVSSTSTSTGESNGKRSSRAVGIWLLVVAAMVFTMVVLGGVTRLTRSGLSIVDWDPIMGTIPPITEDQWHETFDEYKDFPEYDKVNEDMTLGEFKAIFYVEYAHRLLGRLIGLALVVPAIWFALRRQIGRRLLMRLLVIFGLVALEGLLGWVMVASGLVDVPRVSPVRLSLHLLLATLIFGATLWTALDVLRPAAAGAGRVRRPPGGWVLLAFILVVMLTGGIVAGTRAGFAYNTFPLMAGRLIPDGMFAREPLWDNFLENIATVQFQHRVLAIALFVTVVVYGTLLWRRSRTREMRIAAVALIGTASLQVALGITTLLLAVPIGFAAAHQGCALLLFGVMVFVVHESGEPVPAEAPEGTPPREELEPNPA